MTISSGIPNAGGAVLLYKAKDLRGPWEYADVLFLERVWLKDPPLYDNFECVNFLPLGDKWLMLISAEHKQRAYWVLGTYQGGTFTPEQSGPLDGNAYKYPVCFYAPQAFRDEAGRVVLFGWLHDLRDGRQQGYNGAMSLPRVLTIREGTLAMTPAPELQKLRDQHWEFQNLTLTEAGLAEALSEARGECLELHARIAPGTAKQIVVKVRCTPDCGNDKPAQTRIVLNRELPELVIDRRLASMTGGVEGGNACLRFEQGPGEVDLRVFVDRSIVEVFVNDRACLTTRVYPGTAEADRIDLLAIGGTAELRSLHVWKMRPIWPQKPG